MLATVLAIAALFVAMANYELDILNNLIKASFKCDDGLDSCEE